MKVGAPKVVPFHLRTWNRAKTSLSLLNRKVPFLPVASSVSWPPVLGELEAAEVNTVGQEPSPLGSPVRENRDPLIVCAPEPPSKCAASTDPSGRAASEPPNSSPPRRA